MDYTGKNFDINFDLSGRDLYLVTKDRGRRYSEYVARKYACSASDSKRITIESLSAMDKAGFTFDEVTDLMYAFSPSTSSSGTSGATSATRLKKIKEAIERSGDRLFELLNNTLKGDYGDDIKVIFARVINNVIRIFNDTFKRYVTDLGQQIQNMAFRIEVLRKLVDEGMFDAMKAGGIIPSIEAKNNLDLKESSLPDSIALAQKELKTLSTMYESNESLAS